VDEDPDRRALNEAAFREVNERIAEVGESFTPEEMSLVCECSRSACAERLWLDAVEYERVRTVSEWFIVRPGHEQADIEVVIEEWPGFFVVRKRGEAAEISRATDPRSAA
jgi:hypothetical protein